MFIIPITDSNHLRLESDRGTRVRTYIQCLTASLGNTAYFTLQHLGLFFFIGYYKTGSFSTSMKSKVIWNVSIILQVCEELYHGEDYII